MTECVHSDLAQFRENAPCRHFVDYLGGVMQTRGVSCRDKVQQSERDEAISVNHVVRMPLAVHELIVLNARQNELHKQRRRSVFPDFLRSFDVWETASYFHGHFCYNVVSVC